MQTEMDWRRTCRESFSACPVLRIRQCDMGGIFLSIPAWLVSSFLLCWNARLEDAVRCLKDSARVCFRDFRALSVPVLNVTARIVRARQRQRFDANERHAFRFHF